jgi:hypothetical protein
MTREEIERVCEQGKSAVAGAGAGGAVGAAVGTTLCLFLGFVGLAVAPMAASIIGGATAVTAGIGAIRGANGQEEAAEARACEAALHALPGREPAEEPREARFQTVAGMSARE